MVLKDVLWCCGPLEALAEEETAPLKQSSNQYPAQRRFAPTLHTATPSDDHGEDLVEVTIPEGMAPGQTITVLSPDGSRNVRATVPEGLKPGDTFLVRLAKPIQRDALNTQPVEPPVSQPTAADPANHEETELLKLQQDPWNTLGNWFSHSSAPEAKATPIVESRESERSTQRQQQQQQQQQPVKAGTETTEQRQEQESRAPTFVDSLTDMISPTPDVPSSQTDVSTTSNQKYLRVHVPPGVPAGSTIQVEIPGENRTVAATVPPHVEYFHVAYSPRLHVSSPVPPTQAPSFPVTAPRQRRSPTGQKLLLVRVPPGTPPGTTLHVSIPDEPGRILAAQVPPGNVQEFHVSYEARPAHQFSPTASQRAGMLPPANAYQSGTHTPPRRPLQHYQQQRPHFRPRQIRYNERNSDYTLPFVGGAALGAAGAVAYDHFAHQNQGYGLTDITDDYVQDYSGPDYGDTGAGDFGDSDIGDWGGDLGF